MIKDTEGKDGGGELESASIKAHRTLIDMQRVAYHTLKRQIPQHPFASYESQMPIAS